MAYEISSPAVYKNLKTLHKKSYLNAKAVKEGEMAEKKIYSITETGRAYFFELMECYSSNLTDFFFDFNMFLMNLDKVDKKTGLQMLENLQKQINQSL